MRKLEFRFKKGIGELKEWSGVQSGFQGVQWLRLWSVVMESRRCEYDSVTMRIRYLRLENSRWQRRIAIVEMKLRLMSIYPSMRVKIGDIV